MHLLRVFQVGDGNGRHAHDGIHGGADIVAHVGQKLALGPVGVLGLLLGGLRGLAGLLHLLQLLPGQPVVLVEHQQQGGEDNGAAENGQRTPLMAEAGNDGVHGAIRQEGDEVPLGIGQAGAVEVVAFPPHGKLVGVVHPPDHGGLQLLKVLIRRNAVHIVVEHPNPLKIIVAVSVVAADDEGAVPPDDEGVCPLVVLLQREVAADVGHRQPRHQGGAVVLRGGRVGGGHSQQHNFFPPGIGADGHLLLVLAQGIQKRLRVGDGQLRPIEHLKAAVVAVKAQVGKIPGLGLGHELLLKPLVAVDDVGGDGAHQRPQLAHLYPDDALKMNGGLLAHAGHVQRSHLVDGRGALVPHMDGKKGEHTHAQQRHPDQAGKQKPGYPVFHPPASSRKAWMACAVLA